MIKYVQLKKIVCLRQTHEYHLKTLRLVCLLGADCKYSFSETISKSFPLSCSCIMFLLF